MDNIVFEQKNDDPTDNIKDYSTKIGNKKLNTIFWNKDKI
jgi:hypothetical protein